MGDIDDHMSGADRHAGLEGGAQSAVAGRPSPATRDAPPAQTSVDIVALNARDLATAIRMRKVSCVEVMGAYLDQIERVNPRVNAIVALQDRGALIEEAGRRDAELRRGEPVGPLHGLPHAVKDLQPVKGMPFTRGSPLFKDFIASADSLQVARLRAAGVVFIGKTNTPEFGLGSHTVNRVYGATRNAYDQSRSAGGSSGGAAVALALRLAPLADGSDYGGSLRNPAGWNTVCGFRTSFGRVPNDAVDVWTPSMGVLGPMARNIGDLALLLSVQAGFDPRAPLSLDGGGVAFRDPPPLALRGKRIGWLGDFGGSVPHDPAVLEVCARALKHFEALGCVVEEAKPDFDVDQAWRAFIRLRAWHQGAAFLPFADEPAQRVLLNAQCLWELETGARLSAFDLTEAGAVRTQWSQAVHRLFSRYDVLVAATAQLFPFDIELKWPTQIAGVAMQTYHEWMKGVCLVTMAGCPALAAPAGFSPSGLPMGIQIIAPAHEDMRCLQVGAAYEAANPLWKTHAPTMS